ncbi:MAG: hypothetical protein ACLUD1_00865 [Clostridia bacterium]
MTLLGKTYQVSYVRRNIRRSAKAYQKRSKEVEKIAIEDCTKQVQEAIEEERKQEERKKQKKQKEKRNAR